MQILVDTDQGRATQCRSSWIRIRIKGNPINADPCGSGSGSRESHSTWILVDPDPDQGKGHSMRILVDPDPDQGRATECGTLWIRIRIKGEPATQCGSLWIRIRIEGEPLNADPCGSGSGSRESHSTRILVHPDLDLKHCKQ
jgi:hypothetical protein